MAPNGATDGAQKSTTGKAAGREVGGVPLSPTVPSEEPTEMGTVVAPPRLACICT